MAEHVTAVVDTNVLLNLAIPVVDGRPQAPSGADPLKALLTVYDVHTPASVFGEVTDATGDDDLLAAAAELVLQAAHHLTTHDVDDWTDRPLDYGLDRGESECIWLANELEADLFITDEFNTTNYLFITLALDDQNTLFTTPHILCTLATQEVLPVEYVNAALTYYVETKGWDAQYVAQLRKQYLRAHIGECEQDSGMAKAELVADSSALEIGRQRVETDREIRDFVVVGDSIIVVVYEFDSWDEHNLAAFNSQGEKVWEFPSHDELQTPFQSISRTEEGDIRGFTIERSFNIDPSTGDLDGGP